MTRSQKRAVHITTVHHPFDPRIYHKEVLSLKRAGYNVTLIAPYEKEAIGQLQVNYIPIKKWKSRLLRMSLSTMAAYRQAKRLRADYYHIHDPELLLVAWLLKKKENIVIYDIHEDYVTGIQQREYIPRPLRTLLARLYKWVESRLARQLELCLAEKYYQEIYPRGVSILNYPLVDDQALEEGLEAEKQSVRPGAAGERGTLSLVSEGEGSASPTGEEEKKGTAPPRLLYTGNVTVDRGALIHAQLPFLMDNLTVHLVGRCPSSLAEQMYQLAGERKDQLIIEGIGQYVPKETIDELYRQGGWLAGIALFPPTDHYKKKELTKFFEYMNAGLPILCSDFPVWKSFVEQYQCGLAVNPYDKEAIRKAIQFLLDHPAEAQRMGMNGRRAVQDRLNWRTEEKKLIEWYDKLGEGIWVN